MGKTFKIGDRVRYSRAFMRSVGLVTHRSFQPWTITGFAGRDGQFAVLSEPLPVDALKIYTAEELKTDPTLRFLRVNVANIERVK